MHAFQHIFSSVERGYFARQGRGFQTVAVTAELAETEDFRVLEEAAFYAVSRDRRDAGELPVKETFFRLLSAGLPLGAPSIGERTRWGVKEITSLIISSSAAMNCWPPERSLGSEPIVVNSQDGRLLIPTCKTK